MLDLVIQHSYFVSVLLTFYLYFLYLSIQSMYSESTSPKTCPGMTLPSLGSTRIQSPCLSYDFLRLSHSSCFLTEQLSRRPVTLSLMIGYYDDAALMGAAIRDLCLFDFVLKEKNNNDLIQTFYYGFRITLNSKSSKANCQPLLCYDPCEVSNPKNLM